MRSRHLRIPFLALSLSSLGVLALAQDAPAPQAKPAVKSTPQRETVANRSPIRRGRSAKPGSRKSWRRPYKKWLNEDVAYIITDEERQAFKRLATDEEREQFIEQFWLRRDPTPDTVENEFKEEHYRRIAYANEHFASGIPGWKTDRGRIYITYGPPDEIEEHSSGGTYERPPEEGGGTTSTYPVPAVALPLHRGHRHQHHHRIRRSHHVGRIPHDHGPVGKGRLAVCSGRRPHHDRADGHVPQDRPLQQHRRHAPGYADRRTAGEHERVQPPRAVRQTAEAAGDQVQGSGSVR